MKSCILVLLLMVPSLVWAEAPALFGMAGWSTTSDNLNQRHLMLSPLSDRADILWPYSTERQSGLSYGLGIERVDGERKVGAVAAAYSADRPFLSFSYKFSQDWMVEANLGWSHFDFISAQETRTEMTGELTTVWKVSSDLSLSLATKKSSLIQEMLLLNLDQAILYNAVNQSLSYSWQEKWRLQQSTDFRSMDDGNTSWKSEVSLMYALSQFPTWFWMGMGLSHTGFDQVKSEYWSPKSVLIVGPRLDLAVPYRENMVLKVGGSVNSLKEEGSDPSIGSYWRMAAQFGGRETGYAELYWIDNRSSRSDNHWSQQQMGLSANFPL